MIKLNKKGKLENKIQLLHAFKGHKYLKSSQLNIRESGKNVDTLKNRLANPQNYQILR